MNNNMTSSSDSLKENLDNYENQSVSAEFEILAKNISDSSEKSDDDWTQEWVLFHRRQCSLSGIAFKSKKRPRSWTQEWALFPRNQW